eukprot:403376589
MSHMNSSFSDDGRRSDDGKVYSLQVEYSDRGKPTYFMGSRISEEDDESERRSTPPGTIGGESQDVMSEKIGYSIRMLNKKVLASYQKPNAPVYEMMKERIPLPNDNQQILTFKKCYDRLFREFKEKLVLEYSQLRVQYMQEYEENYQANLTEKTTHITDSKNLITHKENDIEITKEKNKAVKQLTQQLLQKKYQNYLKRVAFREIIYHTQIVRREKRLKAYSRNYMFRRQMRLLFGSWRGVTHQWFKERINQESTTYEIKRREDHLVQWDKSVETLKIYMAQLQEKIKVEVEAREQLALTYEQSLNKGVGQLNTETQALADNPLIKEISLIVAQELLNKSKNDANLASILNQSQHNHQMSNSFTGQQHYQTHQQLPQMLYTHQGSQQKTYN